VVTLFYNILCGNALFILDFRQNLIWEGSIVIREPAKTFEDLLVWQKAHAFVLIAYNLSGAFPKHELYGLTSQFRRAAVSIASNIAEGFRRRNAADKVRFFNIAQGSLAECRYYLILARDLGYGNIHDANSLLNEVSKLLDAYTKGILTPNS
jgi:four helix bundle protein